MKEKHLKENVLISLISIQWQDGEKCETELVTRAQLRSGKGFDVITYEETSATGFEGSVTTDKSRGVKERFDNPQRNGKFRAFDRDWKKALLPVRNSLRSYADRRLYARNR